ncbi:MAG TPA: TetR/AcrR family transcriptional regulator [Kaistia sp.]|nr:TetR/AcrR family transcriptional regulator [Kaistia sp.]
MVRPRKDQQIDIRGRAIEETTRLLERTTAAELTMQEVAAAVGCRAPALYNHFRNKDDLLRAVHDAGFERLFAEKLALAGRSAISAFERLRAGGIAYIAFALENPSLYRLMFAPPPSNGAGAAENPFQNDLGLKSLALLRASIVGCQSEGYLPGQDPDVVAFTLWSAVHGAASLMLQDRAPVSEAVNGDRLARRVVDTMMAFVATTRQPGPDAP